MSHDLAAKGSRLRITSIRTRDVRFPTSRVMDGSDAMNPDPDYSAAYVELITDTQLTGSGFVFTIGRGNDVEVAAINSVTPMILGKDVDALLSDMGTTWRSLVYDSHLRWLGPEKGVIHMAIGAVINALWDLKSKRAGLPLWRLLAQMTPVGSARGAVAALLPLRFPGPPAEPAVRLSPQRALHEWLLPAIGVWLMVSTGSGCGSRGSGTG